MGKESVEIDAEPNLDTILTEVGELGRYQIFSLFLILILNCLSGITTYNYMISANTLDYR